MSSQLAIDFEKDADAAIARAAKAQERKRPGWSDSAFRALCGFCALHPVDSFMANEATDWIARHTSLALPQHKRAWGSVFRYAANQGRIRYLGHERVKARHGTPQCRWLIVRGATQ